MKTTAVDVCRFCGQSVLEPDPQLRMALLVVRQTRGFRVIHGWINAIGQIETCED